MRVQIDSQYPLNITVSAADFGKHFAAMNSMEQTAVLRAMIDEMKAHPTQWDYIAIELDNPDNADLRFDLRDIFRSLIPEGV